MIVLRFDVQLDASLGLWPQVYRTFASDEEFFAGYARVIPANITSVEEAPDKLSELDPPNELLADHEKIVEYLDDRLALWRARLQPVQDEDLAAFQDIGQQTVTVYCDTREALSETVEPIVRAHFGNVRGFCAA